LRAAQHAREDRLPGKQVREEKGKTEQESQTGQRVKQEQGAETELNNSKFCPKGPLRHPPGS